LKILLIGETGQVGYELERSLQSAGKVIAVDRAQMDLTDLAKVRDVIRSVKPTLITLMWTGPKASLIVHCSLMGMLLP
jgi:dTDP-4-dehydrorhamnose reductase